MENTAVANARAHSPSEAGPSSASLGKGRTPKSEHKGAWRRACLKQPDGIAGSSFVPAYTRSSSFAAFAHASALARGMDPGAQAAELAVPTT